MTPFALLAADSLAIVGAVAVIIGAYTALGQVTATVRNDDDHGLRPGVRGLRRSLTSPGPARGGRVGSRRAN